MDKKMNVLFISVDDLRPQLGCYGDVDAITPNIDRLAADGTVFQRAYCQQAVCHPSRASLMTGFRPDSIRVWDLNTHFRQYCPDAITVSQYFKNHGYQADCIGKVYHGKKDLQDAPSWSSEAELTYTRGFKYVLEENLKDNLKKAAAAECADVADNAYIDGMVADRAVERLEAMKEEHKPFFLAVGFRKPHLPFCAPKKYWDMQHPERVGQIPNPLPPEDVPQIALHNWRELRGYTDIPELGDLTEDQKVHLRHGYYAAASYVDAQIGRVVDQLDALGLRDNTVICLWGDHGWHLGEHGLWGKTTNFELDTRSPLIFSAPGQAAPGCSSQSLVEFVDIYPTLVDLCGLPEAPGLEGKSLAPVLNEPETKIKDAAISQFPRPWPQGKNGELQRMGYSIRTEQWRYTAWMIPETGEICEQELYSHMNDPLETVNLAGRGEHASTVAEMKDELLKRIKSIRRHRNKSRYIAINEPRV